jgi:hypothetical protein
MPLCKDVLDEFADCNHFSGMDLKDAFWTVPVHPDDRHKTAFATHDMLLQWCVCPQGSKNGATVFARIVQSIFRGKPAEISVYQDDIFTHSKGILKQLGGLEFTFERLRQRGLIAKVTKCTFNYPNIKALGHLITPRGKCPNPKHIEAVLNIATPECEGDVMHILGLLNYNRDYLPALSVEAEALSDLLKEGTNIPLTWKDEIHGKALRKLKRLMTTTPFLQLPDPTRPFRIDVDACNQHGRGKGAILLQQSKTWVPPPGSDLNNVEIPWTPVAYWS